jgi:hypothetical protein
VIAVTVVLNYPVVVRHSPSSNARRSHLLPRELFLDWRRADRARMGSEHLCKREGTRPYPVAARKADPVGSSSLGERDQIERSSPAVAVR